MKTLHSNADLVKILDDLQLACLLLGQLQEQQVAISAVYIICGDINYTEVMKGSEWTNPQYMYNSCRFSFKCVLNVLIEQKPARVVY